MNPLTKYIRPNEDSYGKDAKLHLNLDIYSKSLLSRLEQQTTSDDMRQSRRCFKVCLHEREESKYETCVRTCFSKAQIMKGFLGTQQFQMSFKKQKV